jgi:cell shape-determining protein MreC
LRLDPPRRALLLLLGCLLTALLFPSLLTEQRVSAGALLPGTAAATGSSAQDGPEAVWKEAWVERFSELRRLREELAARPTRLSPSWGEVEFPAARPEEALRAVPARVLHRDVQPQRQSFLIDAGTGEGLRRGHAVVHGNTLVGVVKAVADGASRVLRIDDPSPDTFLPVVIVPTAGGEALDEAVEVRGSGIAHGVGGQRIEVTRLAEGEAQVGDLVLTDFGKFGIPDGLVLGEVVSFDDANRDGQWEAQVEPLHDLDTVVAVYVFVRPALPSHVTPREDRR